MPRRPPGRPRGDLRWSTFLRNQATAILACDFLVTVTATFRLLYVFVVIEHGAAGARASARAGTWSFLQSHALKVVERVVDGVSFVGDAAARSVALPPPLRLCFRLRPAPPVRRKREVSLTRRAERAPETAKRAPEPRASSRTRPPASRQRCRSRTVRHRSRIKTRPPRLGSR